MAFALAYSPNDADCCPGGLSCARRPSKLGESTMPTRRSLRYLHPPLGPRHSPHGTRGAIPHVLLLSLACVDTLAAQGSEIFRQAPIPSPPSWISTALGYEGDLVPNGVVAAAVLPLPNEVALFAERENVVNLGAFGLGNFLPSSIRRAPNRTCVLKPSGNRLVAPG